jgi:hypothetical protein
MKTFKIAAIAFLVLFSAIMIVTPASATCTAFGYFVRVVTFEGKTFAMFREDPVSMTDGIYYQVEVQDSQVAMAVYQAFKGASKAYIRTTQAACSTTVVPGTNRIVLGVADRIGLGY